MTMGDELQRRYPRLIRAICNVCLLAESDAVSALVDYKIFGIREGFGSEAINHRGGQLVAIRYGIQHRHLINSVN